MTERLQKLLAKEGTGISWAALTWNGWLGCTKVSPACDNCYAETLCTNRLGVEWGAHAERKRTSQGYWNKPARWNRIADEAGAILNVFCGSLMDWADNAVSDLWRWDLGRMIVATPHLRWMLLTKRIGNARAMLTAMFPDGVPENVALGLTIANQEEADRDMPKALSIKAGLGIKRLFVSMEPLLGRVDMRRYLIGVDLVIVGGESGKGARHMDESWATTIALDCKLAGVPFHGKQLSQADHPKTYNRPETFPAGFNRREHFA